MKSIHFLASIMCIAVLASCTKDKATPSSPAAGKCKLTVETTNLSGNAATFGYRYSADGNVSSIIRYNGGIPDSTAVFFDHVVTYTAGRTSGSYNIYATSYNGDIFKGLPTTATVNFTLDGVEYRSYMVYEFSYDTKSRLVKVRQTTPNVANDWEYDLSMTYDDKDNVTSLKYENTTGPRGTLAINAAGYDDKPNPFGGIKNWALMMHAGWNGSDPEPIFTALSKNNVLGYTIPGWVRTISYTYSDNGAPSKRTNTNTTPTASYTFEENFSYQCN